MKRKKLSKKVKSKSSSILKDGKSKKREHLFSVTKKDFEIQAYKGSGNGGQKKNKTSSAIRIIHKESGAVACSEQERSQYQNKRIAFKRLVSDPKFKKWIKIKASESMESQREIKKKIELTVDLMMMEKNLKIEIFKDGKWVEV